MTNDKYIELPLKFENLANEAILNLLWTSNLVKRNGKKFFQNYLSSDAQFNVLAILYDSKENLSQKDLSNKLMVDKSNITGLLDRLEKSNFIARIPVAVDRRKYHIVLTEEGKNIVEKIDPVYKSTIDNLTKDFTKKELRQFIELNKKIRIGLSKLDFEFNSDKKI